MPRDKLVELNIAGDTDIVKKVSVLHALPFRSIN